MFQKGWTKIVDDGSPLFDFSKASYHQWNERKAGMKSKTNNEIHGIVRENKETWINEKSKIAGKVEGLCISYEQNMLRVSLQKNGALKGKITWNPYTWEEIDSLNKAVCETVFTIDDFRP